MKRQLCDTYTPEEGCNLLVPCVELIVSPRLGIILEKKNYLYLD